MSVLIAAAAVAAVMAGIPDAGTDTGGRWDYRVDVTTRNMMFGYAPALIIADDGKERFVAGNEQRLRSEVRARLMVSGEYLEFELSPYTVIPDDRIRVNLAGLEASLLAPLNDWLRIGFYHHSAHNFADGRFGFGIDLTGLVADIVLMNDGFTWDGEEGRFRLRWQTHLYSADRATPHVITAATDIDPARIGTTRWRTGLEFTAQHARGRAECGLQLPSQHVIPNSLRLVCAGLYRPGARFFGALGDHFFIGPFLAYGQNFSRIDEFGSNAFESGIRFDILFAEKSTARNRP